MHPLRPARCRSASLPEAPGTREARAGIIDIEHRVFLLLCALLEAAMEEEGFCLPVVLEIAMIIEVVMGKVREYGAIEIDPFHPALIKGMGRDLHYRVADAFFPHVGQERLDLHGFGRRSWPLSAHGGDTGRRWCRSRPPSPPMPARSTL